MLAHEICKIVKHVYIIDLNEQYLKLHYLFKLSINNITINKHTGK